MDNILDSKSLAVLCLFQIKYCTFPYQKCANETNCFSFNSITSNILQLF